MIFILSGILIGVADVEPTLLMMMMTMMTTMMMMMMTTIMMMMMMTMMMMTMMMMMTNDCGCKQSIIFELVIYLRMRHPWRLLNLCSKHIFLIIRMIAANTLNTCLQSPFLRPRPSYGAL